MDNIDDGNSIKYGNSTKYSNNIDSDNIDLSEYEDMAGMAGHERVLDLIVKKDDVTWKTVILELVNSKRMDPWDIDLKMLTKEYLGIIKRLKQHDFRISGKMILAAAMLLKLKSVRLLEGDLNELDRLLSQASSQDDNDLGLADEILPESIQNIQVQGLIPKTPKPRKRKVSIYDLVDALEKALEVKERRIMRRMPSLEIEIPRKKVDVSILMGHLYEKIVHTFSVKKGRVYFNDLTPGPSSEDKVITFIPLLHLTNQRRIDLLQDDHFGPIEVLINKGPYMRNENASELEGRD